MVGVVVREQDRLFFSLWLIKANTSHVLEFPVSGEKESAESEAVGVSHMIKSKMIEQVLFFFKFDSVTRKHPSPLMRVLLNLLFAVLTLASVLTFVIKLYFYFDKLNIWGFFVCFFCFFTDSDINQLIKSL